MVDVLTADGVESLAAYGALLHLKLGIHVLL